MGHAMPIIFFALLAAVDAAAVAAGLGRVPGLPIAPHHAALTIHLAVVAVAFVAVAKWLPSRRRSGAATLAGLAASLCLLTPVLGCLVAGWLTMPQRPARTRGSRFQGLQFGNPFYRASQRSQPTSEGAEPLASSIRHGHRPIQRLAVPRIRQLGDRRAHLLLKALTDQPDARTHLYAQSALSAAFERREKQLESLRRAAATAEITPADRVTRLERLATALLHGAEIDPDQAPRFIAEAASRFAEALEIDPADASCLWGRAHCLIRLGELDGIPDLYGRLCALPGASPLANRLELAYFSALGNWKRTAEAIERISQQGSPASGLGAAHRQFWLVQPGGTPA